MGAKDGAVRGERRERARAGTRCLRVAGPACPNLQRTAPRYLGAAAPALRERTILRTLRKRKKELCEVCLCRR